MGERLFWFPQVFVGHFGSVCCEISHVLTLCPESYASRNLPCRNTEMHRDPQVRYGGEYGVIPLVCRGTVSIFGEDLEKYGLCITVGYFWEESTGRKGGSFPFLLYTLLYLNFLKMTLYIL